jgi:cell division protein FtsW
MGKKNNSHPFELDQGLMLVTLFLIGLGVVQVYSSSFIFATESYGDGLHFVKRQSIFAVVAIGALLASALTPWRWIQKWGWLLWGVAIVGLVLTFVPGFAIKAGGAQRWIHLPLGQRFEPAELMKVSLPLVLGSFLLTRYKEWRPYQWGLASLVLAVPFVLLLKQPDFGTFVICLAVSFITFFVFGLPWRYLIGSATVAIPTLILLVATSPYRYARVKAFLDPWSDPSEKGFQVIQSMMSFHAGGIWGAGLGQGQGKLFFLPEAHTDFTLAVLGEEMGFVGFVVVLSLYGFLIYRGLQISVRNSDTFSKAVALGVTLLLAFGVSINICVVLGLLPTKGLTLPFLSYGGSSLVATAFGVGLLMNIERCTRHLARPKFRGYSVRS